MQPVDYDWSDVGNLATYLSLKEKYQPSQAPVMMINSKNNLVDAPEDMLVALLGIDDMCIVKKENILLITKQKNAEQVHLIVNQLKEHDQQMFL